MYDDFEMYSNHRAYSAASHEADRRWKAHYAERDRLQQEERQREQHQREQRPLEERRLEADRIQEAHRRLMERQLAERRWSVRLNEALPCLPQLTGTRRQIQWAHDIRREWIAEQRDLVGDVDDVVKVLIAQTDSVYWIEDEQQRRREEKEEERRQREGQRQRQEVRRQEERQREEEDQQRRQREEETLRQALAGGTDYTLTTDTVSTQLVSNYYLRSADGLTALRIFYRMGPGYWVWHGLPGKEAVDIPDLEALRAHVVQWIREDRTRPLEERQRQKRQRTGRTLI
jgi:hypothetical protein